MIWEQRLLGVNGKYWRLVVVLVVWTVVGGAIIVLGEQLWQ